MPDGDGAPQPPPASATAPAPDQPSPSEDPVGQPLPAAHRPPTGAATPLSARTVHQAFLARLRVAGHQEEGFHLPRVSSWFKLGVLAVGVLALLPFLTPQWSSVTERLATLGSLVFLVAAVGLWLGLGGRAFLVSTTLVAILYAATAWTPLAFPLADFFVVAVVASFMVFALAGFNLVFVLEEVVYDVHVRLHVRHRAWEALPTLVVLGLAIALPMWTARGGPSLPALWTASVVCTVFLLGWWFVAVVNGLHGGAVLRELHLLVIGSLLASFAADAIGILARLQHLLIPSLVAYLLLIGTWVYVTYTTLQRTHFLLKGEDPAPWVAILLGASLAIVAHAQVLFATKGSSAVTDLADTRLKYLALGLWVGIAFYVVRSLARILAYLRDAGLGERGQRVAGQAARVAGAIEGTGEKVLQGTADVVLRGIDHALPGASAPPRKPSGWEIDEDGLRRL